MSASTIRCLVSAGPTREYFDPVRYVSNPSSGRMGYAIAEAAAEAGWTVDLVSGPTSLPEPEHPDILFYPVETGEEMFRQIDALFDPCDILIMTAAVCDMRPKQPRIKKVKKEDMQMTVEFEPVPDILKTMAARKQPGQTVVGFAAETDRVEDYALGKLQAKKLDWICANKVGGADSAFESEQNKLIVLGKDGQREVLGPASKVEIARKLVALLDASLS